MAMDRDEVGEAVPMILDQVVPSAYERLMPTVYNWLTYEGMMIIVSESSVKLGLGVRANLSPTRELLSKVEDFCRLATVGHMWMCEGADDEHWSLIWGVKQPLFWCTQESLIQFLVDCVGNQTEVRQSFSEQFREFGGADYWDNVANERTTATGFGAVQLLMTAHLG